MTHIDSASLRRAEILPLGDAALLVRFGTRLDESTNRSVLALAEVLQSDPIAGVLEVAPSLVSVLIRYDPDTISLTRLAGETALRLQAPDGHGQKAVHTLAVRFDGPDLAEVAATLGLEPSEFISRHNSAPLRILTTGFAPGFVYCGMHGRDLTLPRRQSLRPMVPAGSVLFAAGQTAIAATDIPTGWHVIGSTDFRNFRPERDPPTILRAGELVQFTVAP
ncbi:sensor histidine kinase inhibitor, KipI family [Devosia lucknowensis]|uniref:Sensor histidine kinase inhibitor, KipI family n=1 Tax=Devosia lucknowensis TaxID=1096929 RepID=A0A1Y6ERC4_9HYPH|nr:allophanate hydrolase subunit 1 [Devosia lucknowensis]SMQ65255.1 sensor histidine kinase inhibitor, KipI family [Devosia lucknowensis]